MRSAELGGVEEGAHKSCYALRRFIEITFALSIVLSTLSCGGAQGNVSANVNNSSTSDSGNAARDINGVTNRIYVNSNGTQVFPQDLSSTTIAAYIPDGTGGFSKITGTGTDNGTFTIRGVTSGKYWLQEGNNFFWTNVSEIDTSTAVLGRPDVVYPKAAATLNVTTNYPATWYVPNFDILRNLGLTEIGTGTWTGTGPWWNNQNDIAPLMDASKGDAGYFLGFSEVNPGSINLMSAIIKFSGPISLTMSDGGTSSINATSTPVLTSKTFRANVAGNAFEALHPLIHPLAAPFDYGYGQSGVNLKVVPFTTQYGTMLNNPDPAYVMSNPYLIAIPQSALSKNTDLGDVPYGNPFPSGFTEYVQYMDSVALGLDDGMVLPGQVGGVTTSMPNATQPVTPLLGPVVSPMINGSNYHTALLTTTTPTLTWNRPSVGTAQYYGVYFAVRTLAPEGYPMVVNPMWFYTADTSITIPPGVLSQNNAYISVIRAFSSPSVDFTKTPLLQGMPFAWADTLSPLSPSASGNGGGNPVSTTSP